MSIGGGGARPPGPGPATKQYDAFRSQIFDFCALKAQ